MSNEAVLRQQLEFLEVQLTDSKQREQDLQRMYDSLLQTLDEESDESKAVEELKQNQVQRDKEHSETLSRLNSQLQSYEKQMRSLKEQLQDSDYRLRTQKLGFEESLMEMRQENLRLKSEKSQLELKIKLQTNDETQSREQLNKSQFMRLEQATKEIERLKEDCEKEVMAVRMQTDVAFGELRQLYEKEKESLETQNRRLQQTLTVLRNEIDREVKDKVEEAKDELAKEISKLQTEKQEAEDKAKKYENELNRALSKLRSKIYTEPKCPRTPLDKTRLMSDHLNSGPEEVKRLRCQLTTCRSIISSLENNEKRSKEQLQQAQEEVERLQRAIRSKANEEHEGRSSSSMKHHERLNSLLIQKDIEIGSLKRHIGELKGELNLKSAKKPPTYSPRSKHSRSQSHKDYGELSPMFTLGVPATPDQSQKKLCTDDLDLDFGSLEEIDKSSSMSSCKVALDYDDSRTTPRNYSSLQTTLIRDDVTSDWQRLVKDLEHRLREQQLAFKELQVERDRAKLDAEKLLIQLKHVKLEWAVEAERYGEKELELKTRLRGVLASVIPKEISQRHARSRSLQCSPN